MAKGIKITEDVEKQIVQMLESGATRKEIMEEFGICYKKVSYIAGKYGFKNQMDSEFRDWFAGEWANIYPGDKVRMETRNNKNSKKKQEVIQ